MPAWPTGSAQATRPVPSTRTRGFARSKRRNTCWSTAQRSYRLNRNAGVAEIANDATVRLIKIEVGQTLNLMAVMTALPARGAEPSTSVRSSGAGCHKSMAQILAKGAKASQYRRWFRGGKLAGFKLQRANAVLRSGTFFLWIKLVLVRAVPGNQTVES